MNASNAVIAEQFQILMAGLVVSAMINLLAYRLGFYTFKKPQIVLPAISLRDVLGAFVFFLAAQTIIVPFLAYLWVSALAGYWVTFKTSITPLQQGWINLAAILVSAIAMLFYCFVIEKKTLKTIAGANGLLSIKRSLKDLAIGVMSWIICYPSVLVLSQALGILVSLLFHPPQIDQVAVKYLKMAYEYPLIFWLTLFGVIFIVPVVEEVLFRGYLQTWLKQKLGLIAGITMASFIFAFFHFAVSQGWHNIEFVISLFFLSCFLGFIYERQSSIWASIGLHMVFNLMSVLMLIRELSIKPVEY